MVKQKYAYRFKLSPLMVLLASLIILLMSTAASAEIKFVPFGYTTPYAGYFMSEREGRDILEGWKSDRMAKERYKQGLEDITAEYKKYSASMAAQIAEIKENHDAEQRAWKKALRKSHAPGFGVFGGVGYTGSGKIEPVVGFGLVWKTF